MKDKLINLLSKINKTFFLILVLAIALRFSNLDLVPPSLNWDEVSHGYNAYSILKTGKDEWGKAFPAIFQAYGDYKLPVYIYLTALSEKVFGLTEFSVRLPSVLAGIGVVVVTYYLTYELFKKKKVANIAAFLVAVEPWSLFLSRAAFEANLALFFIVVGIYFFFRSLHANRSTNYLLPSTIFFGLSVWTYNSARVFTPLILLALIIIYRKEIIDLFKQKPLLSVSSFILILISFVPMLIQLLQPAGQARYGKVSIIDEGAIASINESRGASTLSPILNRAVNNKVTYFAKHFAVNWVSHFSPNFLFLKGGTDYQFSIPGHGVLFAADMIPIVIGLIWIIVKRSKEGKLVLAWLILSPIASAITSEAPHVLRAIVMLPTPMILSALGIYKIAEWLKERVHIPKSAVISVYIIVVIGFLENYLTNYFTDYRTKYSWSWQYGYKEVASYVQENYSKYDKIIITKKYGEAHEFLLFFTAYAPAKYQSDENAIKFYQSEWYWVDRFDKFYFVNDWQIPEGVGIFALESKKEVVNCTQQSVKCLLISSPGKSPYSWRKIKTIDFLNSEPAFEVYTNQK